MCRNSGPEGEGPLTVANGGPPVLQEWYQTQGPVAYRGVKNFKRFFSRMTKIKGVKNWYCSLEMKEKFGMRPLAATS